MLQMYQQVQGFMAYLLAAVGLSACWLRLLQCHKWHWKLWDILNSGPFNICLPVTFNWVADASDVAVAVVDHCGNTRVWQQNWLQHINLAKLLGIWMAANLAPHNVYLEQFQSGILSRRRGQVWPKAIAELDTLTVEKSLTFQWFPSAWNPADALSRNHWDSPRSLLAGQTWTNSAVI